MSWARQVMAILAPPGPGFVKRCTCVTCGAAKKLPTVTAYVYCDYCASLIDYDLRRACEGDTGDMMAPTVAPDSFWPMADTLVKQIEADRALYRSAGLGQLDPDHAEHLTGKLAWSGFCQGWLGMVPAGTAAQLLERAGLTNEYVPVQAEDGQPRHCGGCGAQFSALPGAKAVTVTAAAARLALAAPRSPARPAARP